MPVLKEIFIARARGRKNPLIFLQNFDGMPLGPTDFFILNMLIIFSVSLLVVSLSRSEFKFSFCFRDSQCKFF